MKPGSREGVGVVLAAVTLVAAGCRRDERPTPPSPSASASASPKGLASAASSASASPGPPIASASAGAPFGGPWVRCYASFRPSSTPLRDLTRVSLLCGPSNGMRAIGSPIEGAIDAVPVDHHVELGRGQCVRVFAVSEASVPDLDVTLLTPSGETLAVDGIDDRWPILLPDRPVCVADAGTYTIRLRARQGTGRYAMQAWLLPLHDEHRADLAARTKARTIPGSYTTMTTVHVGLPALHGDVARYAEKFDLLEVRPVDTPLPKAGRLRTWRKQVPPAFVFSVVLPSIVADLRATPDADEALARALETADALEARCIVLTTPISITPTALHKKRLRALVEKLPRDAVTVAWEPRGVWDVEEAQALARDLGVALVVDVTQEAPPRGAVMYTRLRGIGTSTKLGPSAVERVRAAMTGRREVFVVVESATPKRIADALRAPLAGPSRMSTGGVVKPQARMSAEDEEQ